jgi:hypothetical protein
MGQDLLATGSYGTSNVVFKKLDGMAYGSLKQLWRATVW